MQRGVWTYVSQVAQKVSDGLGSGYTFRGGDASNSITSSDLAGNDTLDAFLGKAQQSQSAKIEFTKQNGDNYEVWDDCPDYEGSVYAFGPLSISDPGIEGAQYVLDMKVNGESVGDKWVASDKGDVHNVNGVEKYMGQSGVYIVCPKDLECLNQGSVEIEFKIRDINTPEDATPSEGEGTGSVHLATIVLYGKSGSQSVVALRPDGNLPEGGPGIVSEPITYTLSSDNNELIIEKYEDNGEGEPNEEVGLLGGAKFAIKHPDGYYLKNTNYDTENATLEFTDENKSEKTDTPTEEDAEYLFESVEGKQIVIKNLPAGEYTVEEIVAPEGYDLPEEASQTVTVKAEDSSEENTATSEPGEDTAKIQPIEEKSQPIEDKTTNSNNGQQKQTENAQATETPQGTDETEDEQGNKATFLDTKNGEEENLLKKVDQNGDPVPGAKFTIQNEEGKYLQEDGSFGDEPYEFTSDSDGMVKATVPPGTYTITETEAPEGYEMAEENTVTVTVEKSEEENTSATPNSNTTSNSNTTASTSATAGTEEDDDEALAEMENKKLETPTPDTPTPDTPTPDTPTPETPSTPVQVDTVFRKVIEGAEDVGLEGFEFKLEEEPITKEDEYDSTLRNMGGDPPDHYQQAGGATAPSKQEDGHEWCLLQCEYNECPTDEVKKVGGENEDKAVCTLHGREGSTAEIQQHVQEWNKIKDEYNKKVKEFNEYHQAREKAVKAINERGIKTDEDGYGDLHELKELENDDGEGKIWIIETSVGPNPYFNMDGTTMQLNYTGETVMPNKRRRMDLEGLVWEDIPEQAKDGIERRYGNHIWDEGEPDQLVQPVEVRLKNGDQEIAKGVVTSDGKWRIRCGGKDGENLQYLQDPNTYVEFTYNGMKYQCVPEILKDNDNGSKAMEKTEDRNAFNKKFTTITSNAGDLTSNRAESDGTIVRYTREEQYKSKIRYEGEVTGGFSRSEKESETTGDAKYTVAGEHMPTTDRVDEEEAPDQQEPNYKDNGWADNCYIIEDKQPGDQEYQYKYQIKADTVTADYHISDDYDVGKDTIEHINLGLYEREQPDISLTNDVYKAMVASQDGAGRQKKWYTYGAKTQNPEELFGDQQLGVRFGKNNDEGYKREVYPSEVEADDNQEFEVRVVYRTIIKNESTTLRMQPTEIISNYDSSYIKDSIKCVTDEPENEQESDLVSWQVDSTHMTQNSTHNASDPYQSAYGTVNKVLEPGESVEVYTQYTFGREAAFRIYEMNEVPFYNHIEVNAYTTTKTDQNIFDVSGLTEDYAGVDLDSAAGNSTPPTDNQANDTYEDDTDHAPVFKLVRAQNRKISGYVFKDMVDNQGAGAESKGDGIDNSEPRVSGVQVELVEIDENGNEMLWQPGEERAPAPTKPDGSAQISESPTRWTDGTRADGTTKVELDPDPDNVNGTEQALMITGDDGYYEFEGFIPGHYLIKFTWGNGETATTAARTFQTTSTDDGKILYPEQYKSTVFNDQARYESYLTEGPNPNRWLLEEVSGLDYQGKSDAIDDMGERYALDQTMLVVDGTDTMEGNQSGNYIDVHEKGTLMHSRTPAFEVAVEKQIKEEDVDGKDEISTGNPQLMLNAENVAFGISDRPDINMSLKKQIERVKVVLANGEVLIDATVNDDGTLDPTPLSTIYLGPQANNIGTLKMEMDQEIMEGATMELTYRYTVTNQSNVDKIITTEEETANAYKFKGNAGSNTYYKYGTMDDGNADVEMQPTIILDYLDNKLNYIKPQNDENAPEENRYWERITPEDDQAGRINSHLFNAREKFLYNKYRDNYEDMEDKYKDIQTRMDAVNTAYWTLLRDQSDSGEAKEDKIILTAGQSDVRKLIASKVLADTDEDLEYFNTAEIIQLNKTGGEQPEPIIPGNIVPGEDVPNEKGDEIFTPKIIPAKEGDSTTAERTTITPPTGDIDNNYEQGVWTAVAIISLGVLGAGTAVIKRIIITSTKKK